MSLIMHYPNKFNIIYKTWLAIIIIAYNNQPLSSQQNQAFEEILTQTVLIQTKDSRGSGFLYRFNNFLYLITARHVIVKEPNKASDIIIATCYPSGSTCGEAVRFEISLVNARNNNTFRFGTSHDFIFIEIARFEGMEPHFYGFVRQITPPSLPPKYFPQGAFTNLDSLSLGDGVFLFGYPVALERFNQFDFNRPILRTGTIAGKSCINSGDRTTDYRVLADARVDQGMSGGFVMIKTKRNKFSLIGIMTQFVPRALENPTDTTSNPTYILENSGLSIILSFDVIVSAINKYQMSK